MRVVQLDVHWTLTPSTLQTRFCGDGVTQSGNGEVCDDGNTLACGTCSANCQTLQPAASATGSLDNTDRFRYVDGETLPADGGVYKNCLP